jgi:hypothetical protein
MIPRARCGHIFPWEPRYGTATAKPKACAVDLAELAA